MVVSLVPEDDDAAETALRSALALRYNTVKRFLSLLGESKALDAATGGKRVLDAGELLSIYERFRRLAVGDPVVAFGGPAEGWPAPSAVCGRSWSSSLRTGAPAARHHAE